MIIDQPVILTGRGGSGTRLLSLLASDAGLFLGNELDHTGGSVEWVDLIYRMVVCEAHDLDLPSGSKYRGEIQECATKILEQATLPQSALWGFKLPETMLVMPLLLDAFPLAKIIHLIRHPVSSSLRRTHMTSRFGNEVGNAVLPAAYRYAGRPVEALDTDDSYLHNAYSWSFQVGRVAQYGRTVLSTTQYLEMRYEAICADPEEALRSLISFLGIRTESRSCSVDINHLRQYQWDRRDPRVRQVWEICRMAGRLLGYDDSACVL